jgi:hypothetical protein
MLSTNALLQGQVVAAATALHWYVLPAVITLYKGFMMHGRRGRGWAHVNWRTHVHMHPAANPRNRVTDRPSQFCKAVHPPQQAHAQLQLLPFGMRPCIRTTTRLPLQQPLSSPLVQICCAKRHIMPPTPPWSMHQLVPLSALATGAAGASGDPWRSLTGHSCSPLWPPTLP